jgi:hypothetical protein
MPNPSIRITLRNLTGNNLRRKRLTLAEGTWADAGSAVPAELLSDWGTLRFGSEAEDALSATKGSVAYGTAQNEFVISWNVPFMGNGFVDVASPPGYLSDTIGDTSSSSVSIRIILEPPE